MHYVYILKEKSKNHFYIGSTNDLERRIKEHKKGTTRTTKGREWELYCYFAFSNKIVSQNFEKYLKGGSGRSFSKKHFEFKVDEA
ncbi:GIY-YIG nuclease family protein [Patescibacteria group bacterium]|nr:GIY-YIG nuclease family protein [Patescibacteria group bacterium]MBU1673673.1 GIY-YIG nuclease family protein [Patescibacteria group bacterium]MBU1963839.1 GIY-YIG nuclease family protein [Patescibacteria group bacterium]